MIFLGTLQLMHIVEEKAKDGMGRQWESPQQGLPV